MIGADIAPTLVVSSYGVLHTNESKDGFFCILFSDTDLTKFLELVPKFLRGNHMRTYKNIQSASHHNLTHTKAIP